MNAKKPTTPKPAKKPAAKIVRVKVKDLHFAFDPLLAPLKSDLCDHWRRIANDHKKNPKVRAEAKARQEEAESNWLPLLEDYRKRGIRDPLVVSRRKEGGWWVKEGRNRTNAARILELADVPALITDEDTPTVILGSLKRGHYSKEQLAFLALNLHPYLLDRGAGRVGKSHSECEDGRKFATLEILAAEIGVHPNTMTKARQVQNLVRSSESVRARVVPLLFAGAGFQGILAGEATVDKPANGKPQHGAAARACASLAALAKRLRGDWREVQGDAAMLPSVLAYARAAACALPFEIREEILHALTHPEKTRAEFERDPTTSVIWQKLNPEGES
jgi:hypothetical protein